MYKVCHSAPPSPCSLSVLKRYDLLLAVPLKFQLHNLRNPTLVVAKYIEYMASCARKLPLSLLESYVSYAFSILQYYFQKLFFISLLPSGIKNKLATKTDHFCTVRRQICCVREIMEQGY